ncbi:MAG TPA: right-handed parallel beta-helix repeat-containing protein [Phycisphaerae bacterium]|nr:right-handed parallel beta-helix repeat-containing protein [Phycisphaerae bacterium]
MDVRPLKNVWRLMVLTGGVLLAVSAAPAAVRYVNAAAQGAGDGSSWVNAYTQVGPAMGAAQPGDQVWVAAGRYVEQVQLFGGVRLYGGFAGSEDPATFDLADRDFAANETILDGDQAGNVVQAFWDDVVHETRIDGFTITQGSAEWGGGIWVHGVAPTIANNLIKGNHANTYGGGVYLYTSSATVENNDLAANTAPRGGGLYLRLSDATVTHNRIRSNVADYSGGGIAMNSPSSATIAYNLITGNLVLDTSGGSGGGIALVGSAQTIANNLIIGNGGVYGGGLYITEGSPLAVNNTIVANTGGAGSVYLSDSNATIANSIIAHNATGVYRYSGAPVWRHNCVFGSSAADFFGMADPTGTDGNIALDPLLAGLRYGNAHLQPDSPCIDAGTNALASGPHDFDGEPRVQPAGGTVDMGADEADGTIWAAGPYAIVRVSTEGSDAHDGSTWALAKRTVQAAIDAAALAGGDVWVRAGTYEENVVLPPFAHVFGGFAGSEAARSERDRSANVTVLDGHHDGPVVSAYGGQGGLNTISGFTVTHGRAPGGGGICLTLCSTVVSDNIVMENQASGRGGGLLLYVADATVTNNVISANTAAEGGGLCTISGNPIISNNVIRGNLADRGGGLSCRSRGTIANCTIACNRAAQNFGGALYVLFGEEQLHIVNSLVAYNSSGVYLETYGLPTFGHNCLFGNSTYNYLSHSGLSDPTGSDGNISMDLRFLRTPDAGTDGLWATADDDHGDLRLSPDSPAVDAGDNSYAFGAFDISGQPRVTDGDADGLAVVDMGAYEYRLVIPGDLDGDGEVTLADFGLWRDCLAGPGEDILPLCATADLDGDSDADLGDFALFCRLIAE